MCVREGVVPSSHGESEVLQETPAGMVSGNSDSGVWSSGKRSGSL